MFTGIIEEPGEVKRVSRRGKVALIEISAEKVLIDTKIGDSIAVNGVCLTVVKRESGVLGFEAMQETLSVTNLGLLRLKDKVNLERALKIGERLSGHFVTGHIDSMGVIRKKIIRNDNLCFEISIPLVLSKYCLFKGSIAVDGISLTIMEKKSGVFCVYIIPHTAKNTTLGFKAASDRVNIECDMLVKAVNSGDGSQLNRRSVP